jgi:hypothetical protein
MSPSFKYMDGENPIPTPAGAPVEMTSPGLISEIWPGKRRRIIKMYTKGLLNSNQFFSYSFRRFLIGFVIVILVAVILTVNKATTRTKIPVNANTLPFIAIR